MSINAVKKFDTLNALVGQYNDWFTGVISAGAYSSKAPGEIDALPKWMDSVDFEAINIDGRYITQKNHLLGLHSQAIKQAELFISEPGSEGYTAFTTSFNDFMSQMQGFCQKIAFEQSGLDVLTGLKNNAVLKTDFAIEMERLSREGYPFCLGLARMDDFGNLEPQFGQEQADIYIQKVAQLLKKSLRSYDDAYRVTRDHFVLLLKQNDIVGGQKALIRLRDVLEEAGETYELENEKRPISVSCCVAPPQVGDELADLMDNLKVDLDGQEREQGTVLTYQELSPLQRYIQKEEE